MFSLGESGENVEGQVMWLSYLFERIICVKDVKIKFTGAINKELEENFGITRFDTGFVGCIWTDDKLDLMGQVGFEVGL